MNVRRWIFGALVMALALPFSAEYFCKRFDYAQEKYVKLNEKVGDLEVMDLKFEIPSNSMSQNRCVATVRTTVPAGSRSTWPWRSSTPTETS